MVEGLLLIELRKDWLFTFTLVEIIPRLQSGVQLSSNTVYDTRYGWMR